MSEGEAGFQIEELLRRILRVETVLILLAVAAIAGGDYLFGPYISLGYLYLIPLSYSALAFRPRTTLALVLVCVFLRQWLGPLEFSSWGLIIRDWVLTGLFLSVVTALHRLGKARRDFFETARRQRDELLREVKLAAEVQSQLLSRHLPPTEGIDITARTRQAREVGGDYYDFIRLGESRLGIVVADVSGKGLPAALLMPAVQIALRALAASNRPIEGILGELNQVLYEAVERASYVTLFFGALDLNSSRLVYSNAGHQPPMLLRSDAVEPEWLEIGGTPAGLLPEASYEVGEVYIGSGDLLLLFSDGILEVENEREDQYGRESLLRKVLEMRGASSAELVEAIHADVRRHSGRDLLDDDSTVIVVRIP